ncbi:unnamed protein product [Linum trigynum]|uniref:RNase H type-1 domain-containing protein n=1 Tax=Linum trigynum TaxID=586398 RepID=A0AAV2CKX7_9ROSI
MAEAQAMMWGLKLAMANHFHPMLIESDCQSLIHKLERPDTMNLEIQGNCEEIFDWARRRGEIEWQFWGRKGNEGAHVMARTKCRWEETEAWLSRPPISLVPQLFEDD